MGIKLNVIGVLDNNKANPNTRHKYYPQVTFPTAEGPLKNMDIPKKDRVYVVCDFLTVGHKDDYTSIDAKGHSRVEFTELFNGQVSEIHNIDHPSEDREITKEELLNVFGGEGASVAQSIIIDVSVHLLKGSTLGEEEKKN